MLPLKQTLAAVLMMLILSSAVCVNAAPPVINARAAILLDAKTGQILYEKKCQIRLAPASTTKIMTAIIALESGRLDELVTVSARAAGTGGSSMHLYAGQILTLGELITGLMLRSGNDAAVAIAEHLSGSTDAFVEIMNNKARDIGAVNTQFKNPNGLTAAGHYSTAFDLAWITRYAANNPSFIDIVSTKETNIDWMDRSGREQTKSLRNTNKLLWMLEDADGVKTGTTNEAGPCLVASATRGNQKLISVVLHDHSRWYDSLKLLEYGFNTFALYEYANEGDVLAALPVDSGKAPVVDAVIAVPAVYVVPAADLGSVSVELDLPEKIKAPVYQGQKVGEIIFYVQDKAVKTVDIVAGQSVGERTPITILFDSLLHMFRLLSGWGLI